MLGKVAGFCSVVVLVALEALLYRYKAFKCEVVGRDGNVLDVYTRVDKSCCFPRGVACYLKDMVILDKTYVSGSYQVIACDESLDLFSVQVEDGFIHLTGKDGATCLFLSREDEVVAS